MPQNRKFVGLTIVFAMLGALLVSAVGLAKEHKDSDDADSADDGSQGDRGRGSGQGDDGEAADGRESEDDGENSDDEGDSRNRGRAPGGFASTASGAFDGRYVDFSFDEASCTLTDFRLEGVQVFSSIEMPSPCRLKNRSHDSHVTFVSGPGEGSSQLKIHDNPNGLFRFRADSDDAYTLILSSGVTAEPDGERVRLTVGETEARLFLTDQEEEEEVEEDPDGEGDDEEVPDLDNITGDGNATEEEPQASPPPIGLEVSGSLISVRGAQGNFIGRPLHDGNLPQVQAAIGAGRVGGSVDVLVSDGLVVTEILEYDEVILRADRHEDEAFRFFVESDLVEGRTFAVNFAPGLFRAEQVGVRYFDFDNASLPVEVAIAQASDLADVLSIEAGEGPEFWVVSDDGGKHVLVAVPHWSPHAFEVFGLPAVAVPFIAYGLAFGVVFVAMAAWGMFLGRRPNS